MTTSLCPILAAVLLAVSVVPFRAVARQLRGAAWDGHVRSAFAPVDGIDRVHK